MATLQIHDLNLSAPIFTPFEGTPLDAHQMLEDVAGTWWTPNDLAVLLSDSWEALYYEGTVTEEDVHEGGAYPTHRLISVVMAVHTSSPAIEEV